MKSPALKIDKENPLVKGAFYLSKVILGFLFLGLFTTPISAAAVSWDGGAGNANWSSANNWSNDLVPGADDDVTINVSTTVNIAATTTINSLTLGQNGGGTTPTLNFSYDSLTNGALIIDQGNLTVHQGATITHTQGTTVVAGTVYINVQNGNADILGTINVSIKGFRGVNGPTPGTQMNYAPGGSHGGTGGNNIIANNIATSGNLFAPVTMGSGGGGYTASAGGFGGGAARLNVSGTLTVSGSITAGGGNATTNIYGPGGGAGGSVYLTVGTITGAGTISANGGNGEIYSGTFGGGGGGGRIAIYSNNNSFTGTLAAYGGAGVSAGSTKIGGAGTIFTKLSTDAIGNVIIDNNNQIPPITNDRGMGRTPLLNNTFDLVTVRNYGILELRSGTTLTSSTFDWSNKGIVIDNGGSYSFITGVSDLTIPENAFLFANVSRTYTNLTVNGVLTTTGNLATNAYNINLTITNDLNISSTGTIDVREKGYKSNAGPTKGGGGIACTGHGGAGHGGVGGSGFCNGATAGGISGDALAPTELGSGGGGHADYFGGFGGGAIKLTVNGELQLLGSILADAELRAAGPSSPGGGAGGSIYLILNQFSGNGNISANGGSPGIDSSGGGGGGGRIAIYYRETTFSGAVTVNPGGSGARIGSVGTYNSIPLPQSPTALTQYKSDGITLLDTAGITRETTVVLRVSMSGGGAMDLTPEFEMVESNASFTNTATHTGSPVSYVDTPVTGTVTVTGLLDLTSYKWQSRLCGTSGCSDWVEYDNSAVHLTVVLNITPNLATLFGPSYLIDGSYIKNTAPTFQFTITDENELDQLYFTIQVATDVSFNNVVMEYVSALATQGSKSFTLGGPLNGGVYLVGSIGQELTDGGYYWRVMSTDQLDESSAWSNASDGTVAFIVDTVNPSTNAQNIVFTNATDGEWINIEPSIDWDSATDLDGEILGYCISIREMLVNDGQGSNNPVDSAGILEGIDDGVAFEYCPYIVTTTSINISNVPSLQLAENRRYDISVLAVDMAGNFYGGNSSESENVLSFKYDSVVPVNVTSISGGGGNFSSVNDMYFSWPTTGVIAATDATSGVLGYQYSINNQSSWRGLETDSNTGMSIIPTDEVPPLYLDSTRDSDIVVGPNTIYFRTVDLAGNISSSATYRTASVSFGGDSPTFPGDAVVTISPSSSSTNMFSISWSSATPADGRTISNYYYMVNTPPPSTLATLQGNSATYFYSESTSVSASVLPGVVRGNNTINVVVVDDLGNYSPTNVVSGVFNLESENPDPPKNFSVSDASIKAVSLWRASLAWDVPDYVGLGDLTYKVERSEDGATWSSVGTTKGTAYVDTVSESKLYYWRVASMDSSDISIANPSYANADTLIPKGSYTEAAVLTSGPVSTETTTRKSKILWTTSRTSDSKIAYGIKSGEYLEEEPSNSAQVTDHVISLTNLSPNTTYYYVAKWTDEDGNTGVSPERTIKTDSAPSIKEVKTSNIRLDSAILTFTSLNANRVKIYYGTTTDFGGSKVIETARQESSYSTILTGLNDGTKYYFRLNGFDSEGEEYTGDIYSFETLPRPQVSEITLQQVADTAETTILVSWKSNTAITSIVTVSPSASRDNERDLVDLKLVKGNHSMVVAGLLSSTGYVLLVKGLDALGNMAVSDPISFTTSIDTRPPAISNLKVIGGTVPPVGFAAGTVNAQLVVTWDTDEPSTSQIEFGEGTGTSYSQKTTEDSNLTTNHVVVISGLTPSQVYHLRALSRDAVGNESASIDVVTIAPKATSSALDLVLLNLGEIFRIFGF